MSDTHDLTNLFSDIARLQSRSDLLDETAKALLDVVRWVWPMPPSRAYPVDRAINSANSRPAANALRLLSRLGLVEIEEDEGWRVVARIIPQKEY